jgi:hypothetical protein
MADAQAQAPKQEKRFSAETARGEIQKILDWYLVDLADMTNEKEKSAVMMSIDRLTRAVRAGLLEVKTEAGLQVVQILKSGKDVITYEEIGGEAKCSMDGIPVENHYTRMYTLLGSLSGLGFAAIKKLKGVDNSVAESLGTLFLLCV